MCSSMISPKIIKNEYFNVQSSFAQSSLLEELNQQFSLLQQFQKQSRLYHPKQNIKVKKSNSKVLFKDKVLKSRSKSTLKQPLFYNNYTKKQTLKTQRSFVKENQKQQKPNRSKNSIIKKDASKQKNEIHKQYFGNYQKQDAHLKQVSSKMTQKIKRSLSQIKSSKITPKHYQPIFLRSKNNVQQRQFRLPSIKNTLQQISNSKLQLNHSQYKTHLINSSRLYTNLKETSSPTQINREKSSKPFKILYKFSQKVKTQQQPLTTQQRIDSLNQTLTQVRLLNQIQQKTTLSFIDHIECASSLINITYHNLLTNRSKKETCFTDI